MVGGKYILNFTKSCQQLFRLFYGRGGNPLCLKFDPATVLTISTVVEDFILIPCCILYSMVLHSCMSRKRGYFKLLSD